MRSPDGARDVEITRSVQEIKPKSEQEIRHRSHTKTMVRHSLQTQASFEWSKAEKVVREAGEHLDIPDDGMIPIMKRLKEEKLFHTTQLTYVAADQWRDLGVCIGHQAMIHLKLEALSREQASHSQRMEQAKRFEQVQRLEEVSKLNATGQDHLTLL